MLRVAGPKLDAERERIKAGVQIAGLKEAPSSPSRPFSNKRSGISRREDGDEHSRPDSSVLPEVEAVPSNSRRTLTVAAVAIIVALSVALGVVITPWATATAPEPRSVTRP